MGGVIRFATFDAGRGFGVGVVFMGRRFARRFRNSLWFAIDWHWRRRRGN